MSFTLRGGLIPPSSSPAAPTTTPSLIPTSLSPLRAQTGVVIVYCAGGSVGLMHVAGAGTPVVHVALGRDRAVVARLTRPNVHRRRERRVGHDVLHEVLGKRARVCPFARIGRAHG